MPEVPADKRRGSQDIIVEILEYAANGAAKTRIMHKAMLSFAQIQRYLPALEKAGFLREDSGTWRTTEKGHHVVEACKLCHQLCKEAFGAKNK